MTIASRTPEGSPGSCPVCGAAVVINLADGFGDVPCPACGCLLWFVRIQGGCWLFDPQQVDAAELAALQASLREGLDSLAAAEVAMQIESLARG